MKELLEEIWNYLNMLPRGSLTQEKRDALDTLMDKIDVAIDQIYR